MGRVFSLIKYFKENVCFVCYKKRIINELCDVLVFILEFYCLVVLEKFKKLFLGLEIFKILYIFGVFIFWIK